MDNHSSEKPFKCEHCHKSFKLSCTLKTHTRIHTGDKPFECEVCKKKFTQSGHLKEHARTHTGEKPYQCSECGKAYVNGSHLRAHMRSHSKERPYTCADCGKTFAHLSALKVHSNRHTGGKLYKYGTDIHKDSLKRFSCDVCGSNFRLRHSLKVHLRSHSGDRPFKCELCSKGFTQASHLRSHISTHTSTGRHKCNVCGRVCGSVELARRHARSHVQGVYRCSACGERFQKLTSLKTHARRHTGEKAYKCGVCSRSFSLPSLLVAHIRTHSGEKPFQCEICSKCFAQRSVLACHLRMHKGDKRFACDICTKKFISQSDLVKHRRIHTGEKPYKCEFCNSCFGRSNHLTRHMKIHFRNKKTLNSFDSKEKQQTFDNRDCIIEKYSDQIIHKDINVPNFVTMNNYISHNSCFESAVNNLNRPLLSCQNGTDIQFNTYNNRFINQNSHVVDNYEISNGLDNDYNKRLCNIGNNFISEHSNRYNCDFLKYQTEAYGYCKQINIEQRDHLDNRDNYISDGVRNHYDNLEATYPRLDHFYREDKIAEASSVDTKIKSSCKWRYPNTGIHLKNSCKEVDVKTANNCKPWQCGICDANFSQQTDLVDHVAGHKRTMPRVKYTKLVTNPESGVLEEKEIVPREKLKIVPKEILQPIINAYFTNSDHKKQKKNSDVASSHILKIEDEKVPDLENENNDNLETANESNNPNAGNTQTEQKIHGAEIGNKNDLLIEKEISDLEDEDVRAEFLSNDDSSDFEKPLIEKKPKRIIRKQDSSKILVKMQNADFNSIEKKCQQSKNHKEEYKISRKKIVKKKETLKGKKEYPCTECPKIFKYSHSLRVHSRLHCGLRPYACELCPRRFTQSGQRAQHARTHSGERRHQCQHCGKAFLNSSHLKSHLKTHSGEKPYSCDICNKKFGYLAGWKLHQNIHSGETPYKCEACGRGFRQPSSLRSHLLTHSGEKPYECSRCGARFAQRSTLSAHGRVHGIGAPAGPRQPRPPPDKSFPCPKQGCGKVFGRKAHLKRHMNTHAVVSDTIT